MLKSPETIESRSLYTINIGLVVASVVNQLLTIENLNDFQSFDAFWAGVEEEFGQEGPHMEPVLRAAKTFIRRTYINKFESIMAGSARRGLFCGYHDMWAVFRAALVDTRLNLSEEPCSDSDIDNFEQFISRLFTRMGHRTLVIEDFLHTVRPHLDALRFSDTILAIEAVCLGASIRADAVLGKTDSTIAVDFQHPQDRAIGIAWGRQDIKDLVDFLSRQAPPNL